MRATYTEDKGYPVVTGNTVYKPGLIMLQVVVVVQPRNASAGEDPTATAPPRMSTGIPAQDEAPTPVTAHALNFNEEKVSAIVMPAHPDDKACVRASPNESRLCIVNAAWELTVAAVNPLPVIVVLVAHSWAGLTTRE